ncbi:MAG: hypothetical protein ABJB10_03120 [Mesorhizobium sp.]
MEPDGAALQDGLVGMLANQPALPYLAYDGRGIVICAGGARMVTNAWVLVWLLRKTLHCRLPVEIWHLGPDEMSSGMCEMFESLGATVVDAHKVMARFPARISDGWQLKAYALIMSRFRDVLLLDADNVPVRDPAFLFDTPEYAQTGALFWPDAIDIAATNPIWAQTGLPAEQRTSLESGQLLVDKARHSHALQALLYLNEEADRYYRLIYGDKDTFLVAWLATSSPCHVMSHRPFVDRHVIYQRGLDGEVIFQHRTNGKWNYTAGQSQSDAFVHGDACEAALSELRRIWNGRVFEPPLRSPAARAIQHSMEGRLFILSFPGRDDRELELLAGCQIGRGRDFDCETWHVVDAGPECFTLEVCDRHKVVLRLERRPTDIWLEIDRPQGAAALSPAGPSHASVPRDLSLLRDLVATTIHGGGWSQSAADELRVTLTALSRVDPGIAGDLARHVAELPESPTKAGLLHLAEKLKQTAHDVPPRRGLSSTAEMLMDPAFYVRS